MPVLGTNSEKVFKENDHMNIATETIDDSDDDEKEPLAAVKQKFLQSGSPSSAATSSDDEDSSSSSSSSSTKSAPRAAAAPRSVIARPPTSHGAKKAKPSSAPRSINISTAASKKSVTPKTNAANSTSNKKKTSSTASKAKVTPSNSNFPLLVLSSSDDDDDDLVLSNIAPLSAKSKSKLIRTPKKNGNLSPKKSPKSNNNRSPSKMKSPGSGLFDSPNSRRLKRFQTFCMRLERLWNTKSNDTSRKSRRDYQTYADMVISALSRVEIEQISNQDIREDILKRFDAVAEKKKMKNMTDEEKARYLNEKTAARREKKKEKELNEKKRFEDTTVATDALPTPEPIAIPDGFDGCNYGDILLVLSFLRSYSALLTPKEDVRLVPEEFMKALVDGENGHPYLAKILLILLHTLIHDEEASFRKEMGVRLTDVELNSSTAGELVRLCLRKQHGGYVQEGGDDDDDDTGSKSSYDSNGAEEMDEEMLKEISETDFMDLSASKKLRVLVTLCNRLSTSVAVDNYLIDVMQQHVDLAAERTAASNEFAKLTKEMKDEAKAAPTPPPADPSSDDPTAETGEEDIASKVKRRRLMVEKNAKKEAEVRAAEEKRREKEHQDQKIRKTYETINKKFEEIHILKQIVMRMEPLGTDRHHSRYWYFGKWLPIVFVEKGWTAVDENKATNDVKTETNEPFVESTSPPMGANQWYFFDKVDDLETLLNALCSRGIRESKLKERLETCLREMKTIKESAKSSNQGAAMTAKDYTSLGEDFKLKLVQLETSIGGSGLGGVKDHAAWMAKVNDAVNMEQIADLLIESSMGVISSLLCGALAPLGSTKKETEEKDVKLSPGLLRWRESVRQCRTWSRLHVLLSMFRACIRWDRSIEISKCRICRRKQDDNLALLCDNCNGIYHTYCLRPPLKKPPAGDWFCMDCKPKPPPRAAKQLRRNIYVEDDEEIEEDDEEDARGEEEESHGHENGNAEHDENCIVCGEGEFEDQSDELIVCTECSTPFHLNCHSPPLRHRPRGTWRCHRCVSGYTRKIHSTRLRDKAERGEVANKKKQEANSGGDKDGVGNGGNSDVSKASSTLYGNSDLFDDEGSNAASD